MVAEIYTYLGWFLVGVAVLQLIFLTLRRVAFVFDIVTHYTALLWLLILIDLAILAVLGLTILVIVTAFLALGLTLYLAEYLRRAHTYQGAADDDAPAGLSVMAYNVNYRNTKQSQAIEYVLNARPDVLVLFEVNQDWEWYLMRLANAYPHALVEMDTDDGNGIAFYSKHAFSGGIRWSEEVPYVDVSVGGEVAPLRILGVHLLNPIRIKKSHWAKGVRQVEQLVADIDADAPTLVIGDMNSTPNGNYYRRLIENGALMPAGRGRMLMPTWGPLGIPLLQLDHAFITQAVQVVGDYIGPLNGSDHRPIVTVVRWQAGVAATAQ